jgi:hydroxyethylthiazole kinase-like uncharacterized protein yjeF
MTGAKAVSLGIEALRNMPVPDPGEGADKESRGRVLVIGSSRRVPGAVLLSGVAALRAGAGKVQLAVPASIAAQIGIAFPESGIIALPETEAGEPAAEAESTLLQAAAQAGAVLFGPGLMQQENCTPLVRVLLEQTATPLVLDAAALGQAMKTVTHARSRPLPILTPHAGEMAGLSQRSKAAIEAAPDEAALSVARELGAVVALKGSTTFIADPAGNLWRNDHGAVGLGTAGSGDVLAGIIAGLLARGAQPISATLWGIYIHAKIGEQLARQIGALGFLAREIPVHIPSTLEAAKATSARSPEDT